MRWYDPYYRDEDEPEFFCSACEDRGLMLDGDDDHVCPCSECSRPVTLADIEEFRL